MHPGREIVRAMVRPGRASDVAPCAVANVVSGPPDTCKNEDLLARPEGMEAVFRPSDGRAGSRGVAHAQNGGALIEGAVPLKSASAEA